MTDFRAELQKLVTAYDEHGGRWPQHHEDALSDAVEQARRTLIQNEPEPAGPTDEELEAFLLDVAAKHGDIYWAEPLVLARAVLARWGCPAAQPEVRAVAPTPDDFRRWWRETGPQGLAPSPEMLLTANAWAEAWATQVVRAELAAELAVEAAEDEPAAGEVAALVAALRDPYIAPLLRERTRAAELLQQLAPVQPIPVSERLPGPEDCLDEGWAWFFNPRTGWRQAAQPVHSTYTHWLPFHALPLPITEA